MFNYLFKVTTTLLLMMGAIGCANATLNREQVDQLIAQADAYRLDQESAKVVSFVSLYKNGQLDKTREYHVYSRPNRQSLVVFKSTVEAGQKMLMLQDNFWLQMPKSRRPIRITPMQKLLGEASVGDISSLTWSEDYQGTWQTTEEALDENGLSYATEQLQLIAKTGSASYQKINLWLEKETGFPVKADFYLRSGKLAKKAYFTRGVRDGQLAVTAMTLFDAIQAQQKTVIDYRSVTPWHLADKFYNPSYLARNKSTEL
ncbi:outer membrane lipoprotein-sorting protein [Vibrio panuliri]|uniref:Outer membrane lipoprotein-sorting protein n=1 Tax=Vibrio panuliri TaxID=1381081 RepID=A0A1Q9HJ76_9VIBR|nr:outer membrane lipoprotein-sorting protein [Vibrio panuliri]OLQ90340.1 outer membrane lipoprotein-sorting protein [Vibrio panuliri]